jgi:hypothetical protein
MYICRYQYAYTDICTYLQMQQHGKATLRQPSFRTSSSMQEEQEQEQEEEEEETSPPLLQAQERWKRGLRRQRRRGRR